MFLLDTNTLIDFFRGRGNVSARLLEVPPFEVAVSSVTEYEIEVGIAKSVKSATRRRQFDVLLGEVRVLPFDRDCATAAARVRADLERRGRPIGPLDNLIAGTALAHHATLVTRNRAEFGRIRGLPVLDWHG